jgi:hypothetical protein
MTPLTTASGTVTGAETPKPIIAVLETNAPTAAPELVATIVRDALTSDVPVILLDISFPATPQVRALFIVMINSSFGLKFKFDKVLVNYILSDANITKRYTN